MYLHDKLVRMTCAGRIFNDYKYRNIVAFRSFSFRNACWYVMDRGCTFQNNWASRSNVTSIEIIKKILQLRSEKVEDIVILTHRAGKSIEKLIVRSIDR